MFHKDAIGGDITNLANKRRDADRSQEEIAREVGISRAGYANIEIGKRKPSVAIAKRIGAALGFDWTLFFEEGEEE